MWPEVMPRDPRLPARVRVVEVGPRDGLQNIAAMAPADVKIRFVDMLSASGLPVIEVSSFVSTRAVPQLADAAAVLAGISRRPGTRYTALVPNVTGLERALAAGVRDVAVFTAASEGFTRHNIHASIEESLDRFEVVMQRARHEGVAVRGYVSTAFGCPYDGYVPPRQVLEVTRRLFALGVDEVSIGDTIGVATPATVRAVLSTLLETCAAERLAVHFHDTRGTALANVLAALELGIATVDASAGGLGGCPYAPGASGNLATEDLVYMLHGMGIETGINLRDVAAATRYLCASLNIQAASRYIQASSGA